MASYDDRERIYHKGYRDGFKDGIAHANVMTGLWTNPEMAYEEQTFKPSPPKPRKRRQSPKQKLLTQLTDKKWKQYRKGSGKKTYIEIRAQVSRSQDYKRKAKRLK